ncbi:uncharacterized protein LOC111086768 [Limulus polyphemus]|uniref:Uncharacterized protein LOC111086768 n=1 Tax=Limulus polyphemus TaxID=6850 RepID=A0ABM1SSS0_LIMPO|nr:uncharacterized protein LOC111086768 [Limulus polyphemus]
MDRSVKAHLADTRPSQAVEDDLWSEIASRAEAITCESGRRGQDDQPCGCGKDQTHISLCSCSSHSISRDSNEDQESPNPINCCVPIVVRPRTSRSDQTMDTLWPSEIATRPGFYPHNRSTRFQLQTFIGQHKPTPRPLHSWNNQIHPVYNQRHSTIGRIPISPTGNQVISVSTQTSFENYHYEGHFNGFIGSSNSDSAINLLDQSNNSSMSFQRIHVSNESLPDVVQTPSANPLVQSRNRSQSLTERVQEVGYILKRISREFEESYESEIVQERENCPMLQPRADDEQANRCHSSSTNDAPISPQ